MVTIVKNLLQKLSLNFEYEVDASGNPHAYYFDQIFEHGFMRGVIGVHLEDKMVHIYRFFPTSLPLNRKAELLEFINRINFNNLIGTFHLDLEEMTLSIDSTISLSNDESYNQEQLHTQFYSITGSLNKYFKGALEVGFGDKDPSYVLNKIELNIDPTLN